MTMTFSFNDFSDGELLSAVSRLAASEREATARLVASLAEVDARRLYLSEGCSSLFTYCTQVLHLSEHAAYNRIEAARTARRFPDSRAARRRVNPSQFTVSKETHDKLRRVQDLMRHTIPDGDPSAIFDRALTVLLSELERRKLAAATRPRAAEAASTVSRHVPAAVKRAVWTRDGGRCAFIGNKGRCTETGFLEFHHVMPYADGGETSVENLELRCRPHNAYEAEKYFIAEGPLFVREGRSHDWKASELAPGDCTPRNRDLVQ